MNAFVEIEGFPEYSVDSLGNVRGMKGSILKKKDLTTGYSGFNLYRDGKCSTKKAHRLVAQAFIPNPEKKPFVHHVNSDRKDNRVENLRWATARENNLEGYRTGKRKKGVDSPLALFSKVDLREIFARSEFQGPYQIAQSLGVHHSKIQRVLNGQSYREENM